MGYWLREIMTFNPTDDQNRALVEMKDFLSHHDKNCFLLVGNAGTGKSSIVGEITKEQYLKGRRICVSALSNKATNVIAKKNPYADSMTLHKLLSLKAIEESENLQFKLSFDEKKISHVNYYDIIILDEISQCPDVLFKMLIEKIELYGRKLICLGDNAQLPPVEQQSDSIAFNIENKFELTQIIRQGNDSNIPVFAKEIRNIIKEIKEGYDVPIDTKIEIGECSDIKFYDTSNVFLELIMNDFTSKEYKNNNDFVKVIGYRNNTINKVNELIRRTIFKENLEPLMNGERLILTSPLYESEESRISMMDTSDDIEILEILSTNIYEKNHYGIKIMFPYIETLIKRCDDGLTTKVNILQPSLKDKFDEMMRQWAKNIKGRKDIFRYEWYPFLKKYNVPNYAYTITSHRAQGSTYQKVYMLEDDIDQVKKSDSLTLWKSKYVSSTRPSNELHILNRLQNRPIRKINA